MKKFISLLTALVIVMTMFVASTTTAFAVDSPTAPTEVTEPTTEPTHDNFTVNGETTTDITFTPGDKENEFVFEYVGDGDLTGWDTNFEDFGLVEGVDYEIVYNEDGTMSVTFISDKAIDLWNSNKLQINAKVDEESTTEPSTSPSDEPTEKTTASTTKKDDSSKSPNTGAPTAVIAGTVAVLGAGVAVLAATKKKDAE